jgi:murein L,D-transpeptidase YafK
MNLRPEYRRRRVGRLRTVALFSCAVLLCALAAADDRSPLTPHVDRVLVVKSERKLVLLSHSHVIKTYKVALGGSPVGAKTRQGDHKTPEGVYVLDRRNEHSQFYRSIHISYPSTEDRARARKLGVSPGGDVMLHGLPNGYGWIGGAHRSRDWTDGCIAVTNDEMDEIWRIVPDGTPIEIRP